MDPRACAVPLARKAPPAPAAIPGIFGIDPIVMRMAEIVVIVFGCSVVRKDSACVALRSHVGTLAVAVEAKREIY